MKFSKLGLNSKIVDALTAIGFADATEVQEKTMPHIIKGCDVTVRSQTGSGKTFAYLLPLLQNIDFNDRNVQVLVICPTRELTLQAKEEVDKIKKYYNDIKVTPIYGGSDIQRQISQLKNNKPQIVIGTPGRLIDHITRKTLKLHGIKSVVLDEADEMLNMGFKEDIEKILTQTPSQRQTLMFSATYPKDILKIVEDYQTNPVSIEIGEDNKSLDKIKQTYITVSRLKKMDAVLEIFKKLNPKRAIIFANTKIMAQNLSDFLNRNGYFSQALHGDLRQSTRKKVITEVKTNKVNILVASDVAARGIDINDVDYVINYDVPANVEYYLHRIGRTARAGKSGNALTIVTTKKQLQDLKEYEAQTNSSISEMKMDMSVFIQSEKNASRGKDTGRSRRDSDRRNDGKSGRSSDRSRRSGDRKERSGSRDRFTRDRSESGNRDSFSAGRRDDRSRKTSKLTRNEFGTVVREERSKERYSESRDSNRSDRYSKGASDKRSSSRFGDKQDRGFRSERNFGSRKRSFDSREKSFDSKEDGFSKSRFGKSDKKEFSNNFDKSDRKRSFGKSNSSNSSSTSKFKNKQGRISDFEKNERTSTKTKSNFGSKKPANKKFGNRKNK